jgi:hypothetical protein
VPELYKIIKITHRFNVPMINNLKIIITVLAKAIMTNQNRIFRDWIQRVTWYQVKMDYRKVRHPIQKFLQIYQLIFKSLKKMEKLLKIRVVKMNFIYNKQIVLIKMVLQGQWAIEKILESEMNILLIRVWLDKIHKEVKIIKNKWTPQRRHKNHKLKNKTVSQFKFII